MEISFTIINEWEGGIPSGSIGFYNNIYSVRFRDGTRKSFSVKNCETLDDAKVKADEFRRTYSDEKCLTRNQYRLIECDVEGKYIEMKLQDNFITKFDVEDLSYTQKTAWSAKKGTGSGRYYINQSSRVNDCGYKLFHRIIFPQYRQIDHINRNGLDNRHKNLRPVSSAENNLNQRKRTDNQSGKTGIHYSKCDNLWIAQWSEDGKRKKKSFSVNKYGMDGAKLMALNHIQKTHNKLGLNNGNESGDEIDVIIKPVSLDRVNIKENLLSTNKSGKKGVYFMEKYNFWAVEYTDVDGMKRCKRFYVSSKRVYEEARRLAMDY